MDILNGTTGDSVDVSNRAKVYSGYEFSPSYDNEGMKTITSGVVAGDGSLVLKLYYQRKEELEEPETPEKPEMPETPEIPETPETPEEPETPETPETPEEPETPNELASQKKPITQTNLAIENPTVQKDTDKSNSVDMKVTSPKTGDCSYYELLLLLFAGLTILCLMTMVKLAQHFGKRIKKDFS